MYCYQVFFVNIKTILIYSTFFLFHYAKLIVNINICKTIGYIFDLLKENDRNLWKLIIVVFLNNFYLPSSLFVLSSHVSCLSLCSLCCELRCFKISNMVVLTILLLLMIGCLVKSLLLQKFSLWFSLLTIRCWFVRFCFVSFCLVLQDLLGKFIALNIRL